MFGITLLPLVASILWQQAVQDDLASLRKAVRADALSNVRGSVMLVGRTMYMGSGVSITLSFDSAGGFLQKIGGNLPVRAGYDGNVAWDTDWSGAPMPLSFRERDDQLILGWMISGYWLNPKSGVSFTRDEHLTNVFHVRFPSGPWRGKLIVDPLTHRPMELTSGAGDQVKRVEFIDWREEKGLMIPRRVKIVESGVPADIQFDTLSTTSKSESFAMPKWTGADTTFRSDVPDLEVKRAKTGHLLVHPKLNGKDVGWFIFDSGAGAMAIDTKVADTLGLKGFGKIAAVGIGGSVLSKLCTVRELELGPMTIRNLKLVQIDLGDIGKVMGAEVAGIVGYDVFYRSVVELNLTRLVLRLHEPKAFSNPSLAWSPLLFSSRNPAATATFEGGKSEYFRLDTGSTDTVVFHAPAVERHELLKNRQTQGTTVGGVGGFRSARVGHIEYFELGGYKFENPRVRFAQGDQGALADPYLGGNIGQTFLVPFTIFFDYRKQRISFQLPQNSGN